MVPNHMGLDSAWVVEHPERFMQVQTPPYPAYSFTGVDLCEHPDVSLQIEDGYWTHRDAAVVFKRVDQRSGEVAYLYHGNDGTSMPWNDTAQLDFLNAQVREAVVETILEVARRFPVIRFDAAMTLAKKHFQRLWYPRPGDVGSVPSRVEHGLSRQAFDERFPVEFWREVVDRVAREAPDTLLLAEAFWLMEGYFVRTLGMHRVYNSAFMHMLMKEDNAEYRASIKNVLAFDPGILKRFVNFMNNPDERSAAEQFGRGDKYFGVALMLVGMPGLPMLGHGQIEGFAEKYGMEYRRSYHDEPVDTGLVQRHQREIFPLLRRRSRFSGVEHFALFDLQTDGGAVDEDVFAWCNGAGDDRTLMVVHNAYRDTAGWLRLAAPVNRGTGEQPQLESMDLCGALGLSRAADRVCLLRDHISGLTRVAACSELSERGLRLELGAYHYAAWVSIREVHDEDGAWHRLAQRLGTRGVADPHAAVQDLRTGALQRALAGCVSAWSAWRPAGAGADQAPRALRELLDELQEKGVVQQDLDELEAVLEERLGATARFLASPEARDLPAAVERALFAGVPDDAAGRARFAAVPLAWMLLACLRGLPWTGAGAQRELPPSLRLEPALARALKTLGGDEWGAQRDAALVMLQAEVDLAGACWPGAEAVRGRLAGWLGVNEHEGVRYLDRAQLESLLYFWQLLALLPGVAGTGSDPELALARARTAADLLAQAAASGYRL